MSKRLSIFAAAREAPAQPGLLVEDRQLCWEELAELAGRRLRELDGAPVWLVADNTLETAVTIYALLEAHTPALLIHPRLTASERTAIMQGAERSGKALPPGTLAAIFTSGTTGNPRGAMLSRAAFLASAAAVADHFGWAPGERWLACMPLAHVGGFSILIRSLAARRCAALAGGFDADRLPEWISRRRITLLSLVPTMLKRLLDAHPAWAPPAHLRCVVLGGAAAPPKLIDQASRRRIPLVLTYGLTEACSQVTATAYEDRFAPPMDHAGTPLSNVSLRIQEGRVQIRGPVVMSGYLGQPELPPDSWFDTGDLGELDALGRLHIHARRTDLIVRGGENVYPAEVERVLESFPGVLAAGVFGVPDEVWGQTVAAALVCDARTSPLAPSVAAFCAAHLAPFKCPRRICFVSALPQTAAGKLDRAGLARFAEQ